MPDFLVPLYALPPAAPSLEAAAQRGVEIRRGLVPEQHVVTAWVREAFSEAWASETAVSFARQPVACFVAVQGARPVGFCAYEATCRSFLGPLGVAAELRAHGIGSALLLAALHAMAAEGYAYAIIGGAGPTAFFEQVAGARIIEGSVPGIYGGMLRVNPPPSP